jgi:hypothetical protein
MASIVWYSPPDNHTAIEDVLGSSEFEYLLQHTHIESICMEDRIAEAMSTAASTHHRLEVLLPRRHQLHHTILLLLPTL